MLRVLFERFTVRARQVVVLAQEEARASGHNYIGTEHILMGLMREEEGLAARVLRSLDVTIERVRAEVVQLAPAGDQPTAGMIPFTPAGQRVLERSLHEALDLGRKEIGTEHILLSLVRESDDPATRILLALGADADNIRNETIRIVPGRK